MRVLRVMAEGVVTSFRYPFFVQGVQPTLPMPPLATIYGHICSALGGPFDPRLMRVGYTFTYQAEFSDLEHLHFVDNSKDVVNPFVRRLLFEPRLTLYVDYADLEALFWAFRRPVYPVVLGRSQDLMTYTDIRIVDLIEAEAAYFEGTLLPPEMAAAVEGNTVTYTLARYIDEWRQPQWARFAALIGRGRFPAEGYLLPEGVPSRVWADADFREYPGHPELPRGVWFHAFVEEGA